MAALALSSLDALQFQIQGIGLQNPYQHLLAMRYIAAIIALLLRQKTGRATAMQGMSYYRD